ncbi:MAG: AraC family transcriptional regulator [Spirochaetes bacterium]|nr:AraC family transcriptional regulator [Spirochaetota bacterium]
MIQQHVIYRPSRAPHGVPFGLRSVGRAVFQPHAESGSRRIRFVQVLWTVRGEGFVRIGKNDCRVSEHHAAVCMPESEHRLASGAKPWEYRWFTIDGTYAAAVIKSLAIPKTPFPANITQKDFNLLARVIRSRARGSEAAASAEVYRILATLATASVRHVPEGNDDAILDDITKTFTDPDCSVQSVAERLGVNRATVNRHCRELLSMPAKEYVDSLRLERALTMLSEGGRTTAEVARAAGFIDPNYFAKFFRRKMGMSPGQFRDMP